MATQALPPGAVRRRTAFGLFDADGWTWASIKAFFWFLLIIFLLGYLPDRAYYFVVSPHIDVGYNVISPINFCPAQNNLSTCPAPAGAVVPWDPNPPELALPEGRAGAGIYSSGENIYLIGGRTPSGATASVLTSAVTEGNLSPWAEAAALPEPRADAAVVNVAGTPYVVGGRDASGAPLATVVRGTIEEGLLTGWEPADDLELPVALADLSAVASSSGIYAFGGSTAEGVSAAVYHAEFDTAVPPALQAWQEVTELPLPAPRADATALAVGNLVFVIGGQDDQGPSDLVFFLALDNEGAPQVDPSTGRPYGWGLSAEQAAGFALPEPRARHASFTNGGAIYVLGGVNADGLVTNSMYWAVPDAATGAINDWRALEELGLEEARADASVLSIAGQAFIIGGEGSSGLLASSERASLALEAPFFRLGLFGATVPGLGIGGNVGQELGWLAAAGVATANFVVLILIGWAYSHQRQTLRFLAWLSRGRIKVPPEEEPALR